MSLRPVTLMLRAIDAWPVLLVSGVPIVVFACARAFSSLMSARKAVGLELLLVVAALVVVLVHTLIAPHLSVRHFEGCIVCAVSCGH
jgi:hypothetical protein